MLEDLRKELKDAVLDANNYKGKSDRLEKDLTKERGFADATKKRLDQLGEQMNKQATDHRKLNEQHEKA